MPTTLTPSVFKAYDIRGIVPSQINADFAYLLGRALGQRAKKLNIDTIVIGYDGRLSSPSLSDALHHGVTDEGVNTLDTGMVPTPLVYYVTYSQQYGASVAITGSHNPPDYNGFKMMMAGKAIYGDDVLSLRTEMQALQDSPVSSNKGKRNECTPFDDYVNRVTSDVKLKRPMKIAIDCGNGVASTIATRLFKTLGCEVDELFCEVDGTFPNHHPDPADPHNLEDLIKHVQSTDCEIGLAFDGDGDRLGVVTKSGSIIWPDRQLILFAKDVLSRCPGETIIYDVKCSRHVALEVRKAGGKPLMWKTGHSLVKAKLAETGAPLAGEMSGHVFFKERWYGFDDGLYTGARILEILSASDNPTEVLNALPDAISTPELKVAMKEGEPHKVIAALQTQTDRFKAAEIHTIDGIRAEYEDGFGLARASNTTPVIVIRFEADTQAAIERIQAIFREVLLDIAPEAKLPF